MRTEDLKRTILKTFRGNEFYGYEVHKKLAIQGPKVEMSRLYRVLNEMLKEGYLESSWVKSDVGPKKRVYRLGRKGREELDRILLESIETVHEYYREYLLSLPPETSVFEGICRPLTNQLKGQGNIAYVSPKYSVMQQRIIQTLQSKVHRGRIYFVSPGSMTAELPTHLLVLDTLFLLDGNYDSIPLKEGYVDLLFVIDLPQKDHLEASLDEWLRVLKPSGTLAILTPTALAHKKDPLSIGDFIERYEHEALEKRKLVDREFVEQFLKGSFEKVEERQIVHLTIFQASKPRSRNWSKKIGFAVKLLD